MNRCLCPGAWARRTGEVVVRPRTRRESAAHRGAYILGVDQKIEAIATAGGWRGRAALALLPVLGVAVAGCGSVKARHPDRPPDGGGVSDGQPAPVPPDAAAPDQPVAGPDAASSAAPPLDGPPPPDVTLPDAAAPDGARCTPASCKPFEVCRTAGGTIQCANPAQSISKVRWDVPCGALTADGEACADLPGGGTVCPTMPPGHRPVDQTFVLDGSPGTFYDLLVHFRGVVEPHVYTGGIADRDHFYVDGMPASSTYNVFALSVSAPMHTYYLNSDEGRGESHYVLPLDHRKTIRVEGGATIHLWVEDPDCLMVRNCMSFTEGSSCTPFAFPEVPPSSGLYVQMDVEGVSLVASP
jgi:hypothetical protein